MNKVWRILSTSPTEYPELDCQLTSTTISILRNRGIESTADILDFLRPSLLELNSPFLFKDMDSVISRIVRAKENNEKILIYGDYDVDGITSTALLFKVFKEFGYDVYVHIPHRSEGYGIRNEVIDKAAQSSFKLIISVDCGITAIDEVLYASEKGIDFIITDHHEPQSKLPSCIGIIDPKVEDCGYPFKELAGVGVAYKLVQAFCQRVSDVPTNFCEREYLDLVALGTIADVVPLVGENRIIVANGLKQMKETIHIGLRALLEECGLFNKIPKAGQISFIVAPRINAAGRLDTAKIALNLLLEENYNEALELARELSKENVQRQDVERKILAEADAMINKEQLPNAIVLSSPDWHHGVIGIVASKLVERYYRPVFIIAEVEGKGKGSARGIAGYHVLNELHLQADLMIHYGGHKQAAGFTMPIENIELLRKSLNENIGNISSDIFKQKVVIDSEIRIQDVSLELFDEIEQLAPFGMGNPTPLFVTKGINIQQVYSLGKEKKHLKLHIEASDNAIIEGLAFNQGENIDEIKTAQNIDVVYNIDKNEYMGQEKVQINIRDYDLAQNNEVDMEFRDNSFKKDERPVLNRDILARLYIKLKNNAKIENPFLYTAQDDNEKIMLKIFEEMGIITVCGGTEPFIIKLNEVKDKLNLNSSLRFRVYSSPEFEGKD